MRRAAWIFLAAILLPCLALAWLAIHSEQDQQIILQHQQAIIDQGVADSLAQNVRNETDGIIADFVQTTRRMLTASQSPNDLAQGFNGKIRKEWSLTEVGFAVDLQGTLYAPRRADGLPAEIFRKENESFLSNREDAEVYSNAGTPQNLVSESLPMAPQRGLAENQIAESPSVDHAANSSSPASNTSLSSAAAAPPNSTPVATSQAAMDSSAESAKGSMALSTKIHASSIDNLQASRDAEAKEAQRARSSQDEIAVAESSGGALENLKQKTISTTSAAAPRSAAPMATTSSDASQAPTISNLSLTASTPPEIPASPKPALASPADTLTTAQSAFLFQAQKQVARVERQVAPQENTRAPDAALSNVIPAQSDFRQLIGQSTSGSVARFLEDKLCLLVWSLPARSPIIFGAQLNQDRLVDKLRVLVRPDANRSSLDSSFGSRADYCLALLDDKGQPVALSQPGFKTDWKHPFVATEIGSVLPHWEAALYLTDPGQVSHSAGVLHFTIGLITLLLVVAILAGGSLIGADVGRQMRLAQQKTDFVSNVSHELKTPLTSIRMFADMLSEGRVEDPEKQSTYLRIISAESARLTRLINNVLDFARLERRAPSGEPHPCDLVEAAREVVETCQPHLESAGIMLQFEVEAESLPLLGDRDALSQIVLNLISNAEKYGGGEIMVRTRLQDATVGPIGCIDVFDRGPGIPSKQVELVFAPFRRLDDSLASGVPGSGLGLTLARRMARAHGGNVTYQPRAGGGSCFTLALPLFPVKS